MISLQPVEIGRDRRGAGLDTAVISIDGRLCRGGGGGERIVEEGSDIVVQRALVALEREAIVATLIDDLLSDRALTVQRKIQITAKVRVTSTPVR